MRKYSYELKKLDSKVAFELGRLFVQEAELLDLAIVVDISLMNKRLFYFSTEGANPDKFNWVNRKQNIVKLFNCSSLEVQEKMEKSKDDFYVKYGLEPKDYAPVAGSVPIISLEGMTMGIVTVSGLKPHEDHDLVIRMLDKYKG